jgi:hypothetical protein
MARIFKYFKVPVVKGGIAAICCFGRSRIREVKPTGERYDLLSEWNSVGLFVQRLAANGERSGIQRLNRPRDLILRRAILHLVTLDGVLRFCGSLCL